MERSPTLPRGSDGPSSISLWCSLNLRQGDTFTLFKNKSLWLLAMNSLQTCKGLKVIFNKIDVFFHPSNSLKRIYEKVPKSTDAEGDVSKLSGAGNMHNCVCKKMSFNGSDPTGCTFIAQKVSWILECAHTYASKHTQISNGWITFLHWVYRY